MWREESGVLEMFLAYYQEFEENLTSQRSYRDFLLDVLCAHEESVRSRPLKASNDEAPPEDQLEDHDGQDVDYPPSGLRSSVIRLENYLLTCGAAAMDPEHFQDRFDGYPEHPDHEETSTGFAVKLEKKEDNEEVEEECEVVMRSVSELAANVPTFPRATVAACGPRRAEEGNTPLFLHAQNLNRELGLAPTNFPPPSLDNNPICSAAAASFACSFCFKMFTKKNALTIHERIHTGERPYKCKICHKTFAQAGVLQRHCRIHTGERPYACRICQKTFRESGNLRKHERLHLGE